MSRVSETLFEGFDVPHEGTGEPVRVTGSHRLTIAIHTVNLTGRVHIEATLSPEPSEADWFPVFEPIAFPRPGVKTKTDAEARTIKGNYVFIRARLSRPGLSEDATKDNRYGIVDRVLLNR